MWVSEKEGWKKIHLIAFLLGQSTQPTQGRTWRTELKTVAAYLGFDPRVTLKLFYEKSLAMAQVKILSIFVLAGRKTFMSNHKSDFTEDLLFFDGLYCLWGTDCSKMLRRSDSDFKTVLQAKCDTYGHKCSANIAFSGHNFRTFEARWNHPC